MSAKLRKARTPSGGGTRPAGRRPGSVPPPPPARAARPTPADALSRLASACNGGVGPAGRVDRVHQFPQRGPPQVRVLCQEVVKERCPGPRQGGNDDRRPIGGCGDLGMPLELLVQATLNDEALDQFIMAAEAAGR